MFEELLNDLRQAEWNVLGVDGFPGAGKSTLASRVAGALGIRCVHLDDFLANRHGKFLDGLRYSDLSAALQEQPVIVEGLCLHAVMERLSVKIDFFVYVDSRQDTETKQSTDMLVSEVCEYARAYTPSDIADFIFKPNLTEKKMSHSPNQGDDRSVTSVDIALINAKTKIALTLAVGGILTLLVGLVILLYGTSGQDEALIKIGTMQLSARGIGGVIMVTSVGWAYFAYRCRPIYKRSHDVTETYDPNTQSITGLQERRSSTMVE